MTTRYLTVAEEKTYLRSEITVDDTLIEQAINSAETIIDNACQRRFEVASSSTARVFIPSGSTVQIINDCTVIASVVDNGTTLVNNVDYQREPLNGLSATGETWPYYRLRRLNGWWYSSTNTATITVTATWGWAAIPPQVKESCKIITKDLLEMRDIKFGLVAITEAGGVGTRENRIVRDMIATYAHPFSIGIS